MGVQKPTPRMTPTICFVCDIGEQVNRSVAPTVIDHPQAKNEDNQGIFSRKVLQCVKKIMASYICDKLHVLFVVLKGSNPIGSPPLELEQSRRFRSRRKRKLDGVFTSPENNTTTNDLMPAIRIHMNGDDEVAPSAVLQSREDGDGENLKATEVHQILLPVDSSKGNQSPTTFGIKTKGILTPMEKGSSISSKTSSASREESDSTALGIPSRWGDKSAGINFRTRKGHFSRDVRGRSTEFKEVIEDVGVHRRKVLSSSTSMASMKMNKRTADRLNQRKSNLSAISIKDLTKSSCGWGLDRPQKKVQLVDITATLNDWSTTNKTAQNACSNERAFQWSVDRGKSTSKNTARLGSNGETDPSSTGYGHSTSDSEIDSDVEEFPLPTNAKEIASVVTTVTSTRTSENPCGRHSECRIKSTSVSSQKGNMGVGKDDAIVHGDGSTKRSSVVTDCIKVGVQFVPPPVPLQSANDSQQSHYSPTAHPRRYPPPGKGDHHGLSTKWRDSRRRTLSKHRILQHKQEMMPLSRKKVVISSTTSHQTVCEVIFHQRENDSYSAGHQIKTHDILLCWCTTVQQRQSNDESLPWHLTLVWTKNLSSVAREPGSRLVLHEPFFEIDSSHLPCNGLIALTGQSLLPSNSSFYVVSPPTSIEQSVENMINLVRAKGLSYALKYFRQESNSQKVTSNDKCGGELHYPCVAIARNEMKLFSGFLNELLFQEHRRYNVFAKLIRIYLHPSLLGSHLQSQCPGVTEINREVLYSGRVPLFEDDASGILLIQLVHTRELAKVVIRGDVGRWINFYLSASEQFFLICGLRFLRLSCIDALSANVMRHMSTKSGVSVSESRRLNKFTCALFDVDDATVHIERAPPCWRKSTSVIRVSSCRSLWLCMLSDDVRPPECESLRQSFVYRRVTMLVSCQRWIKLQEFHRFCADEVECQSREDYRLHDVHITTSKDFACGYETSAKTRGAAPFHPYVQGYLFVSDQSLMFDSASKNEISPSNIYDHPLVIAVMSSALMSQIEALFSNVSSASGPLLMLHDVLVKQRQFFYEKESASVAPKKEDPQFCFPLLYADCFSSICRIEEFNTMQSNCGLETSPPDCRFGGELLIPSEILLPSSSRSESMCFISLIPLSNLYHLI
jgi:hypothetical protein